MNNKNIFQSKYMHKTAKTMVFFLTLGCISLPSEAWSQSFNQKLFIPDTLSTADHDTIPLIIKNTERVFFPGATTSVIPGFPAFAGDTMPVHTMSYTNPKTNNPGILGPTLVWWKGDSITMAVKNELMDTTTTHWHGAHVAPRNDGGPHQVIPPHTTWYPSFKVRDDATTMWYHPHLHMMTMMQVNMGMAGMILIKDKNDPFMNVLPHSYGVDEFPLILQDKFFIQDTAMDMSHGHMNKPQDKIDTTCSMGTTFLVNGTWQPYLDVPAQNTRFRILNGSSERAYCLFLRDSSAHSWVPFSVIASDAGYLDKPYAMGIPPQQQGNLDSLLMIMSGERYEIVFDASKLQGHDLYLMNMRNLMVGNDQILSFAGGPNLNDPGCYATVISDTAAGMLPNLNFDSTPLALMKINVGTANGKPGTLPKEFAPYNIPNAEQTAVTRNKSLLLYNSDPNSPPFSIDSINYEMEVINDTIYLGDIEVWNVTNTSTVAHPFHIHDIHFFITSITNVNGKKMSVPPYMRGPKDVAPVTDSSSFSLIMQFNDFATPIEPENSYMYHCHILAHEDGGMMHQFVVTPPMLTAVNSSELNAALKVYPNPSNDELWVESNLANRSTIKLYDLSDHLLKTWEMNTGKAKLDVRDVSTGIYLLQIETNEGRSTQRIAIAH